MDLGCGGRLSWQCFVGLFKHVFLSAYSCHLRFWSSERTGSPFGHLVDILRRMFCGVDCDSDRYGHTEVAKLLRKHGGKTGEELKAEGK